MPATDPHQAQYEGVHPSKDLQGRFPLVRCVLGLSGRWLRSRVTMYQREGIKEAEEQYIGQRIPNCVYIIVRRKYKNEQFFRISFSPISKYMK